MSKQLLDNLNTEQKKAVLEKSGPLLILAGAGSGKTRVLTHRFAHLASKTSPDKILAMTFTNKAAGEMRERIESLIKKDIKGTWVGTFHSQCNRILRREIAALDYRGDFSIYDNYDQCNLVRHILKEFKIYEAMYKGILSRISSLKSASISPEEFISNGEGYGFEEKLARVYVRYQDELKRCNALDYDDLIMLCIRLFEENPGTLKKYQSMFDNILVDEFQDTNPAQYRLLRLLAEDHQNICVVGDDDQSIYAFRGANVQNILSFEKDYPDAKVIKLERNYRSTQNILHVSGCIIKNNSQRREKVLKSQRGDGEQVCHCWFPNEKDEAAYISKLIKEFYLKGIYDYRDFAVLYRINLQSKPLEDALRRERLPYRVLGGMSFYQRKEIKDITPSTRMTTSA
jgi:DNA helicase-2/ATP-dependent DNA helicase PcrA